MIAMLVFVGVLAGVLAGYVMKRGGYGMRWDIILGLVGSIAGSWIFWALLARSRADRASGSRLYRGGVALCAATAVALLVSVVTDIVITGLRLYEVRLPAAALVPVLSIAAEIALVSMLIAPIRATIRRIA
jgi:uncharacterized membrane protein YeaQ/YmgE (transglycosylase-associated protein family)